MIMYVSAYSVQLWNVCVGFYEIGQTLRLNKLNILVHADFRANLFVTNHTVDALIKNKGKCLNGCNINM